MKFTNILIAKSPAANETIAGIIISELKAKEDCTKVSSQAPNIVGSPRRSEKYIASDFFIPRYRATINVIPDLDTPGTKATAWARPM